MIDGRFKQKYFQVIFLTNEPHFLNMFCALDSSGYMDFQIKQTECLFINKHGVYVAFNRPHRISQCRNSPSLPYQITNAMLSHEMAFWLSGLPLEDKLQTFFLKKD